jgi:hypothetical protein
MQGLPQQQDAQENKGEPGAQKDKEPALLPRTPRRYFVEAICTRQSQSRTKQGQEQPKLCSQARRGHQTE